MKNTGTTRQQMQSPEESFDILLIDDNPDDVLIVKEALQTMESQTTLHTISKGTDAVEMLRQENKDALPFLPDLALVDLKLPGKDGCDVLEAIRDNSQLENLPVIMLTNSRDSKDITRCYNANANAYLTKSEDPEEFISIVKEVERFWLKTAQLPPIPQ